MRVIVAIDEAILNAFDYCNHIDQHSKFMSVIDSQVIREAVEEENAEEFFSHALIEKLALLVQMETRHVMETSCKFMFKDRRDILQQEDVVEAVREHGYLDLIVDQLNSPRKDPYLTMHDQCFEEELEMLEKISIKQGHLEGRWIFINGKIPATSENKEIRSLSQSLADKQREKIIKYIPLQPLEILSIEERQYFRLMSRAIRDNINPRGEFTLEGDLNSMLPFFLKFLGEEQLNQTGVWFLMKLIENSYIWPGIQFSLKKILILLLGYRGQYSFEVGTKLADLIENFQIKYPMLRDIFVGYPDQSYSTLLKKIPLELRLGIPFQVSQALLQKCKEDCKKGDQIARKFMDTVLCYCSELRHFKQLLMKTKSAYIYWHPCRELTTDPYLTLF